MTIASTQVSCFAPVLEACCPIGRRLKLQLTESCVEVSAVASDGQQPVRPQGAFGCTFMLNDPVSLSSCLVQLVSASGYPAADTLRIVEEALTRLRNILSKNSEVQPLPGRVQWIHFGFTPSNFDCPEARADVIFEVVPRAK